MTRKGEAQINLDDLSEEHRKALAEAIVKLQPQLVVDASRAARAARAKANQPRKVERKTKARKPSIGLKPATKPEDTLHQTRRSFGDAWVDDAANPSVEVVSVESHVSARINTYAEGRWFHRRVGDDAVVVAVKLQDGKTETRKFTRGVLDADWKRS